MMNNKYTESSRVTTLIPDALIETTDALIVFLKKYYEFMNQEGAPTWVLENSVLQRDVFQATDIYLDLLFKEYGFSWAVNKDAHRANIIAHLDQIYKAKGSLDSIKLLFRLLTGEEVEIVLPKDYVLRPSEGAWTQDVSVICKVISGDPATLTGKFVSVSTKFPNRPIQTFEVEVLSVTKRTDYVCELYISRYFSGYFHFGSIITLDGVQVELLPSMAQICTIKNGGSGFRIADTYLINNFKRNHCYTHIKNNVDRVLSFKLLPFIQHLFEEQQFERWFLADTKTSKFEKETVTRWYETDGTTYEEIIRNNAIISRIVRGADQIDDIFDYKSLPYFKRTTLKEYFAAPDITINWDQLIIELFDFISTGTCANYADLFKETYTVNGLAYQLADFNLDGKIDEADLLCLIRRSLGLSILVDGQSTDQFEIRDRIDNELIRLIKTRNINTPLIIDEGSGAIVRVIKATGAGVIEELKLTTFGYNFPKVFFTYISPATFNKVFDLYVYSGYVDISYTYDDAEKATAEISLSSRAVAYGNFTYADRKGFLSDVNMIHDGKYYQDFSYVVQAESKPAYVEQMVKQTVHPAGLEVFAQQTLMNNLTLDDASRDTDHHYLTNAVSEIFYKYVSDLVYYSETVKKIVTKTVGLYSNDTYQTDDYIVADYSMVPEDYIGILDQGTITHVTSNQFGPVTRVIRFANDRIFP
jgi:hypothetical protein